MAYAGVPLFDFLGAAPFPARRESPLTLVPAPPPVEPGTRKEVRQLQADLQARLTSSLTSGTELVQSLSKQRHHGVAPTTLQPLDAMLGGGLPRGKMVEMTGRPGSGRFSIVMATLAGATSAGEAAALIDIGNHFDPQFAVAAGVELQRMLWIRPDTLKQGVTAAEMVGASGFQFVILDAGTPPLRGRRVPDAAWVRLARMAEAHGTVLLVSSPYALTGTASEAVVQAERGRARWVGSGKAPRVFAGSEIDVRLTKHRRMRAGTTASLEFRVMDAVSEEDAPLL